MHILVTHFKHIGKIQHTAKTEEMSPQIVVQSLHFNVKRIIIVQEGQTVCQQSKSFPMCFDFVMRRRLFQHLGRAILFFSHRPKTQQPESHSLFIWCLSCIFHGVNCADWFILGREKVQKSNQTTNNTWAREKLPSSFLYSWNIKFQT